MSQIEVPTTVTSVPGRSTPAPGTETNESTLPTATATSERQPEPVGEVGAQRAGAGAERVEVGPELCDRAGEPGCGCVEVLRRRQARVGRPERLVAGGAAAAALDAGQLPDDPVGRLDELGGGLIDLAVLLVDLRAAWGSTTPMRSARRSVRGRARCAPGRARSGGRPEPERHGASRASARRGSRAPLVTAGTGACRPRSVGSTVQEVKSTPIPITRRGIDARLRRAPAGCRARSTSM